MAYMSPVEATKGQSMALTQFNIKIIKTFKTVNTSFNCGSIYEIRTQNIGSRILQSETKTNSSRINSELKQADISK
jgi:hypothetical protein